MAELDDLLREFLILECSAVALDIFAKALKLPCADNMKAVGGSLLPHERGGGRDGQGGFIAAGVNTRRRVLGGRCEEEESVAKAGDIAGEEEAFFDAHAIQEGSIAAVEVVELHGAVGVDVEFAVVL